MLNFDTNVVIISDLKHSLIMAEFGSSRDTEHLDVVFKNLRSIIETPVHS